MSALAVPASEVTALHEEVARLRRHLAAAHQALARLARLDGVTGLPNRVVLAEWLRSAITARHDGERIGVLFVGLDGFKAVNESLGHVTGDRVLAEAGARLSRAFGGTCMVARLAGDEFAVVAPGLRDRSQAEEMALRALEALAAPLTLRRRPLRLAASIGIAVAPDDGAEPGALMGAADAAMDRAKDEARGSYRVFTPPMGHAAAMRLGLECALARAIERRQFVFHYQPKMRLDDRGLAGVEALLRWRHPHRGLLAPAHFLATADETGIAVELLPASLEMACSQLAQWDAAGLRIPSVAVNLSARQFGDARLAAIVEQALGRHGLEASRLEVEITETAMLQFEGRTASNLASLAALGVALSLDDFGTGYSNLAYLKRLPISCLKVDRSFVNDLGADRDSRPLVAAIIAMARSLGMRVVAEGVETEAQRDILAAMGCDEAQGYLVAAPLPPAQVARLYAQAG